MRFTVVATGQFSLDRAFGFGLAASSLTQLSVVNSPIRPAGLSPAWHPASPAHTRTPKSEWVAHAARVPVWAARQNLRLTFFVRFWREKVCGTRFSASRRKPHASGVRSPCGCAALDFGLKEFFTAWIRPKLELQSGSPRIMHRVSPRALLVGLHRHAEFDGLGIGFLEVV